MQPVKSHPEQIRLAGQLRDHVSRAQDQVARRLADARAHAADGSTALAAERLNELTAALHWHLDEARGAFYWDAGAVPRDPAIYRDDVELSAEGEAVARTAPIGGRDQAADLTARVAAAAGELPGAAAAGESALALWEARHRDGIGGHVRMAMSDAQIALHNAVGRTLVREDLK